MFNAFTKLALLLSTVLGNAEKIVTGHAANNTGTLFKDNVTPDPSPRQ